MALALYRLGRWCAAHAKVVLALWLVALVVAGAAAASLGRPVTSEVTIPGSQFEAVQSDLQREIPDASGGFAAVVVRSEDGDALDAKQRAAIRRVFATWKKEDEVADVIDPFTTQAELDDSRTRLREGREKLDDGQKRYDAGKKKLDEAEGKLKFAKDGLEQLKRTDPTNPAIPRNQAVVDEGEKKIVPAREKLDRARKQLIEARKDLRDGQMLVDSAGDTRLVTKDGSTAVAQVRFTKSVPSVAPETKDAVVAEGESLADAGVVIDYSADITQSTKIIGPGEAIGVLVAGLVLLIALGSLVAAGLPIASALIGVAVGLAGAMASTHFYTMHQLTPSLALMLGLAVGIDYALFIVNRHRTQLLAGAPMLESIGRATGTAGSAVVVAGTTVVIALAALFVTGIPLLAQMGFVASSTVAVAVLVALTLTPALLGIVRTRVLSRRSWRSAGFVEPGVLPEGGHGDEHAEDHGHWYARLVTRHPVLVALGVIAICGALAWPATTLRLGLPDGSSQPAETTGHRTFELVADNFGPGQNGPIVAVVSHDDPVAKDDITHEQAVVAEVMGRTEGVAAVVPFGVSEDRRTLAFQVVPDGGPADEHTATTVQLLKGTAGSLGERLDAEVGLTGQTVANIEISKKLADALPVYLAIVIGLSLLLLLAVFRSLLVPLVATGGFLLSVGAAFGTTVAVYQWGWLGRIFDVDTPGPILSFMPVMLVGVLFGLAMDYQMFLVAGMKEAHAHGEPARKAVITGFGHGAKVVTAAALIMASVFAGFVFAELTMIRPMGFGLAVGVLVDAVLVRMTLVPALMHVLGESAWWMPRWLGRILPTLDVEGTSLTEHLDESAAPVDDVPEGAHA